ncbi:enoyl-CoA hydratase/isomerase family protein [Roseateles sp. BYS180W]|uniref:Enoyl-CoA hydratase/isomerase family protein n=1 Tax=Roseateles rivi TaxID=3299028 RepID=A0ABW7FWH6_9BURK
MSTPTLHVDGPLATLTLNRPQQANHLTVEDLEQLSQHLQTLANRPEVRVLLLQAQGKHFCSGFDLSALSAVDAPALFERIVQQLAQLPQPRVAAINGGVFGGGTDLALACDFRIGTTASRMFIPAARIGLHYHRGGMQRLVQQIGLSAAKRLLLTGEEFDAAAMLRCGFLDEVTPSNEALGQRAQALCDTLCALAPLAVQGMRRHLDAIASGTLDSAQLEQDMARCRDSADWAEGLLALQERRIPRFSGH